MLVIFPAGDGKIANLFTVHYQENPASCRVGVETKATASPKDNRFELFLCGSVCLSADSSWWKDRDVGMGVILCDSEASFLSLH
jgi:hypothetical protein